MLKEFKCVIYSATLAVTVGCARYSGSSGGTIQDINLGTRFEYLRADGIRVVCTAPRPTVVQAARRQTVQAQVQLLARGGNAQGEVSDSTVLQNIRPSAEDRETDAYEIRRFALCEAYGQNAFTPERYGVLLERLTFSQHRQDGDNPDGAPVDSVSVDLVIARIDTVRVRSEDRYSPVQTSLNCHNKKDGEEGCPSNHTFVITAEGFLGKLHSPSIECVRDDRGSCEWNAPRIHSARFSISDRRIEGRVSVSSRSIDLQMKATEDVYQTVTRDTVIASWKYLTPGSTFVAKVSPELNPRFKLVRNRGERTFAVGQSNDVLKLVSLLQLQGGVFEYNYLVIGRAAEAN